MLLAQRLFCEIAVISFFYRRSQIRQRQDRGYRCYVSAILSISVNGFLLNKFWSFFEWI